MARFGSVDFDERIINAIRDDKLVIFAGAGVSMGSPSNLPSFWKLAKDIASGTGLEPTAPLDRFLGTLNNKGIDVHQRAIEPLSPEGSKPNDLHRNIIKLFRESNRIKLITTNFDLLFEEAYKERQNDDSFSGEPNIYRAPALPQGYDFNGIVYVHGALPQLSYHRTKDMVLTDADFGRAYLTEGWARRFLVDVFREFTVLFIGYSHNDAIMNYLARALPADRLSGRFALTDDIGNWKLLGIEPIIFKKHTNSPTPYEDLYESIKQLSELTSRGVLEWERRIIELSKAPPTDNDALKGEIRHILERDDTTKLFVKYIRGEEWPVWLEEQGNLKALFDNKPLNNRDDMLAKWLAKDYLNTHPNTLLKLAFKHNLKISPRLWEQLGREIGKNKSLEKTTFERWIDILIITKPTQTHRESPCYDFVLSRIAKQSHEYGASLSALKAFMAMNDYDIKASFQKTKDWSYKLVSANHHMHSEDAKHVWESYIKPNIESIATHLLKSATNRLEEMSNSLHIWNHGALELGWNRMAIETLDEDHGDNVNTTDIDAIVDAARDTLEFLGANESESLDLWTSILIKSKAPILRRLAIHASTINTNWQPEEKLKWIIDNCDLSTQPEHHEMYRAVAISYKLCKENMRHEFVKQILDIRANSNNQEGIDPERQNTQKIFNWLTWLVKTMPSCSIAEINLRKIKAKTPYLNEPPNVEFPYWFNMAKYYNPSISSAQKAQACQIEQIDDVKIETTYEEIIDGVYRNPLLHEIIEIFSQNPEYILNLAKELSKLKQQNSDLLDHILHCLGRVNLTKDQCVSILNILNNTDLIKNQGKWVSTLLLIINRNTNGLLLHPDLINTTNNLVRNIWTSISPKFISSTKENWIFESVDSADGTLVLFWIEEIRLKISNFETTQQTLPDDYKRLFETIIRDSLERGYLGIPILLMNTNLLFSLDEPWTRQNIIPLLTFNDQDQNHLFEQAWDGLLETGDLNPVLIRELESDTLSALLNLKGKNRRSKLMKLLSRIVINHDDNPNEELIPRIFNNSSKDEIVCFYNQLWHSLPDSKNNEQLKSIWGRWMKNHFENRIENIPTKLNKEETIIMIDIIASMLHANHESILLISKFPKVHTPRYYMICEELKNSELLETHPTETAQVIIHILGCSEIDDQLSEIIKGIIDTLLGKVSKTLKRRLEEEKVLLP